MPPDPACDAGALELPLDPACDAGALELLLDPACDAGALELLVFELDELEPPHPAIPSASTTVNRLASLAGRDLMAFDMCVSVSHAVGERGLPVGISPLPRLLDASPNKTPAAPHPSQEPRGESCRDAP
jgi:hypothetical protein